MISLIKLEDRRLLKIDNDYWMLDLVTSFEFGKESVLVKFIGHEQRYYEPVATALRKFLDRE